jgi:ATP-dependent Zn protease
MSAGMTGADVVKTCARAQRRARNAGRLVTSDDLMVAIAGGENRVDHDSQLRIAIHEAGHAVAALASPVLTLAQVTIVGRGDVEGGTMMRPKNETVITPAVFDAFLTALLSGRAAEEILLGEISAGAGGREGCDLSRATLLAAEAELSLGMRDQGLIWYAPLSVEKLAQLFAHRRDLEQAVRERLDASYDRARELIKVKAPLAPKTGQAVADQQGDDRRGERRTIPRCGRRGSGASTKPQHRRHLDSLSLTQSLRPLQGPNVVRPLRQLRAHPGHSAASDSRPEAVIA